MFESEYCKVEYLKNKNSIFCQWKKFANVENYRAPLEFGLKLINKHCASTWITDTSNGFENEPEDTQWLIETFMPKVIDSSCKNIVFVIQENSPLNEEIAQQSIALSQSFNVRTVSSLGEV